jgi:2',3'-cyclic-nucleotide 2'-phosphodiesterase (5'-nucleotidase family)
MNRMGYEAGTLGNHEFDRGDEYLARCLSHARFSIVQSNVTVGAANPLADRFRPYAVIERSGLKIGIIGLMNDDLSLISMPGPDVQVSGDFVGVTQRLVTELREKQGVNLVVVLAHIGLDRSRELARKVSGVDVIAVGNQVTLVEQGRELVRGPDGRAVVVVQPGEKAEYLGILKLQVGAKGVEDHHWQPIRLDGRVPEDPDMLAWVQTYQKQRKPDKVITRTLTPIDTRKKILRTAEAPMGSLVTDLMRSRFDTEIALFNGGGIRGNILFAPGTLMRSDLEEFFPFGNKVVVGRMAGRDLVRALERGVAALPEAKGPFLQVSGLRYTIDPQADPQVLAMDQSGQVTGALKEGRRVTAVMIQEADGGYRPLDENRIYRLALSDFLADGGDGYAVFRNLTDRTDTGLMVLDLMEQELVKKESITPEVFGRITFAGP